MTLTSEIDSQEKLLSALSGFAYPDARSFRILESKDGAVAVYQGDIVHGSAEAFKRYLAKNANLELLGIHSGGGRMSEAFIMAEEVRARILTTFVYRECASAASLLYCSGAVRNLHDSAKITFHGVRSVESSDFQKSSSDKHVERLISFGIAPYFSRRVYATLPSSSWEPTREELISANVIKNLIAGGFDEDALFYEVGMEKGNLLEELVGLLASESWAKILPVAHPLADKGHAFAQHVLGHMFANGKGVDIDFAKAAMWYGLAADQNYDTSLNNLGIMYRQGRGVPKNEEIAIEMIKKAAGLGNPEAIENERIRKRREQLNIGSWWTNLFRSK